MVLIREKIETFVVNKECPSCKKGQMKFNGYEGCEAWINNRPLEMPHTCSEQACLFQDKYPQKYPILQYIPVAGTEERLEE